MNTPCLICQNNKDNQSFLVKELQLGLQETFSYQLCSQCGSMQLVNPPSDFSRYYPNENYYSFTRKRKDVKEPGVLQSVKASYLLYGKNKFLGKLLSIGYKVPEHYHWMRNANAVPEDAILDVGCGNGSLLTQLYRIGFKNLTGIDPFIDKDYDEGIIKLYKKEIFDLHQQFDLIMMHHSLEHMFQPQQALKKAFELLKSGKDLLVRIPVMGNYGWHKYGTYWCGIDAPRHIFIPSENGMRTLAEQAGFLIQKVEYDSSDYVIWSSEQYKLGIPLHASNSRMMGKSNSIFSKDQIEDFKRTISIENQKNNGDTAAFYLRKP